jgi:hypothetical protein
MYRALRQIKGKLEVSGYFATELPIRPAGRGGRSGGEGGHGTAKPDSVIPQIQNLPIFNH